MIAGRNNFRAREGSHPSHKSLVFGEAETRNSHVWRLIPACESGRTKAKKKPGHSWSLQGKHGGGNEHDWLLARNKSYYTLVSGSIQREVNCSCLWARAGTLHFAFIIQKCCTKGHGKNIYVYFKFKCCNPI